MKTNLRKQAMAFLMTAVLMLSMSIPAFAAEDDTSFADVAPNAWYADSVKYVRDNNLMSGTSATTFDPNGNTSRAMLVTALYRQAGSPAVQAASFSDVSANSWYSSAVAWASTNNIAGGYSDNRFGPNDPVTREQVASILWRAQESPAISNSNQFADQTTISAYAVTAVNWARANNMISGKSGNLFDPAGLATRAETAAILYRYLNLADEDGTSNTPATSETAITITVGDSVISATLNNSTAAQELISRMPLTVSMNRSSADYYATLSNPLGYDEADVHNGWHNGDIGFDRSGNYLTIFYSGEDTSASNGNQVTLGHVNDLTLLSGLGASIQATFALADTSGNTPGNPDTAAHRTLVVYYSHSQRTENVAKLLQEKVNGDIYELNPANPYTGNDNTIAARSTQEIESGNLPAFSGTLPDLSQYDTILVGGPVWNYTVSAPMLSYLRQTDFSGKTVAAFWTDQGGPGNYRETFTSAIRNATRVTDFLQLSNTTSISGTDMDDQLDAWLKLVLN